LTIFLRLDRTKSPNKVGYVFDDAPYTYREIMSNLAKLATCLRREGIKEGDKV